MCPKKKELLEIRNMIAELNSLVEGLKDKLEEQPQKVE